ncbi:hypothetical protein L873DRAFT_1717142 [Choiromyces venosus 120613-1]|uniref:Uncharacterized protein n=1 Tax=Choiromyces venosus 120613-1 TaxID=1336337 RepID=A0A3N4J011_9PEZI|nr:hypothetical protein L873DRAFT_1717142 [Choiromyces venosus 120613-1]
MWRWEGSGCLTVCLPALYSNSQPTCWEWLPENPSFLLIGNNAHAHNAGFTDWEREKQGVLKVN